MKTEDFGTDTAAFLEALHGKKRQKRGRTTRPDIPSAPRVSPTGLIPLIAPTRGSNKPAWSYTFDVVKGHRLYVINAHAFDTGYCVSEAAACAAAREGNNGN
jgi:hypothetical protein